jgi:hypothetical protein
MTKQAKKRKPTKEQRASLRRARGGMSIANYEAIYEGFLEMGIEEDEIEPRVNVLTFQAWRALGRTVKKGEHGVRVTTWVNVQGKEAEEEGEHLYPRLTVVFHISQTVELEAAQ